MQMLKLGDTAKALGLSPERTRELLDANTIPNLRKSGAKRDTYHVPEPFIDYAKTMLGLSKNKEFRKLDLTPINVLTD